MRWLVCKTHFRDFCHHSSTVSAIGFHGFHHPQIKAAKKHNDIIMFPSPMQPLSASTFWRLRSFQYNSDDDFRLSSSLRGWVGLCVYALGKPDLKRKLDGLAPAPSALWIVELHRLLWQHYCVLHLPAGEEDNTDNVTRFSWKHVSLPWPWALHLNGCVCLDVL